jgi:LytR cell envelope-related transcriptional attenuator
MTFARARALVVVGALFAGAAILALAALVRDSQGTLSVVAACPKGAIQVNVSLPDDNKDVKIKVFNGTSRPGLAESVGEDFSRRGFSVDKTKVNSPTAVDQIAILRFGPKAFGAAWLLRAYFLDELGTNDVQYVPQRSDDVVDVVVGKKFQELARDTEFRQALAALGQPILPTGSCPTDAA